MGTQLSDSRPQIWFQPLSIAVKFISKRRFRQYGQALCYWGKELLYSAASFPSVLVRLQQEYGREKPFNLPEIAPMLIGLTAPILLLKRCLQSLKSENQNLLVK